MCTFLIKETGLLTYIRVSRTKTKCFYAGLPNISIWDYLTYSILENLVLLISVFNTIYGKLENGLLMTPVKINYLGLLPTT